MGKEFGSRGTHDASPAAGTAMATGYETYNAGIGVDAEGNPVENISERALALGKAAGAISSEALTAGETPDRVFGIAQTATTLQQARSGVSTTPYTVPFNENVPSLESMTKGAESISVVRLWLGRAAGRVR